MVSLLLAAGADPTQLDVRYSSHRLISYCPDEMHVTSDFGEVKSCFAIHCYNRQCRSLFLSSLNAALILPSLFRGRPPYFLAKTKEVRDAFRRARVSAEGEDSLLRYLLSLLYMTFCKLPEYLTFKKRVSMSISVRCSISIDIDISVFEGCRNVLISNTNISNTFYFHISCAIHCRAVCVGCCGRARCSDRCDHRVIKRCQEKHS